MSVTITQTPQAYTPSDNPVRYTFNSDQTAQPNFSFLIEAYVNGVVIGSYLRFPEINGDTCHFDLNEENIGRIRCPKPVIDTAFSAIDASNTCTVKIKVTERYGSPATSHSYAIGTEVSLFKACLSDEDYVNFDYIDYLFGYHHRPSKWITLFPNDTEKYYCGLTENVYLMHLIDGVAVDIQISLFDASGAFITLDTISPGISSKFILINASPQKIIDNSLLTSLDFAGCAFYSISVTYGGIDSSVPFVIYIDLSCDQWDTKRLHFMSSIGSMESYSFIKKNTPKREVVHNGFERQWGAYNASNEYVYETSQGREVDYMTTSTGKQTISSDFMTEGVQNWLVRELTESSYVLMSTGLATPLKRVKVLNTAYELKTAKSGELIREEFELNLSDARRSALIS